MALCGSSGTVEPALPPSLFSFLTFVTDGLPSSHANVLQASPGLLKAVHAACSRLFCPSLKKNTQLTLKGHFREAFQALPGTVLLPCAPITLLVSYHDSREIEVEHLLYVPGSVGGPGEKAVNRRTSRGKR